MRLAEVQKKPNVKNVIPIRHL